MRFKRSLQMCVTLLTLAILYPVGNSFGADTILPFVVTGLAATLSAPTGIAVDGNYNVFLTDTGNNKVLMFNSSGALVVTVGTGTAGFRPTIVGGTGIDTLVRDPNIRLTTPAGVAVDATGNIYIADSGNNRVHMVLVDTTTKVISVNSRIITIAGNGLAAFSGDGGASNLASINNPTGVAVDAAGNVLIADNGNNRIRKVVTPKVNATTGLVTYGNISTIAGDGRAVTLTAFGIALSPAPAGDLYIADSGNNRILKMTGAIGAPATIAGTGVAGYSGAGGLAVQARLNQPSGVATDGRNLYVADTLNNCIRMISLSTGVMSTRAGLLKQPLPLPLINGSSTGFPLYPAIDTTPLPLTSPMGLTLDSTGNVYIADTINNEIETITPPVSALTTATPPGGTYSTAQTVSFVASKAAAISWSYQEIDPLLGTPVATTIPLPVAGTGSITLPVPATPGNAIELIYSSKDISGNVEKNNTAVYVTDAVAPITTATVYATPAITPTNVVAPVQGIIYSARTTLLVTLTSNKPIGTTIYYTTTGVAPTVLPANLYTVPFAIPVTGVLTTTNVQFFSIDAAGNREVIQSQKYNVVALSATALPAGGTYRSDQTVTLTSNNPNGAIWYSLDGGAYALYKDPTLASAGPPVVLAGNNSKPISWPVTVTMATHTVTYYVTDAVLTAERIPVQNQIYVIDKVAPITSFSPPGGLYNTPQTATLTTDDPTATIYYTTTGIAPTTASTKYTAPILIAANTTLMFFAVDPAGNRGVIQTVLYTIDTVAPVTTASLASGTYASVQSVKLTCNDPTATVYFTIDGSQPTIASAKYSAPLTVSKTTVLNFFAQDPAGNPEAIKTQSYTIITLTTTAAPMGGVFNATQTVELTTNSVGATIMYTLNPITPAPNYSVYKAPILMSASNTTLMYYAIDAAGVTETTKTEIYTMDTEAPSTSPVCTISTVTSSASGAPIATTYDAIRLTATDTIDPQPRIKYIANTPTNLDNSVATPTFIPAYTLTDYTKPITFGANTIVKFFATDAAGNTEQIKTAYCPTTAAVAAVPAAPAVPPLPAVGAGVTPQDFNPSLYLNTLPNDSTTVPSTSNASLFITGNVAPFATTTLDLNGITIKPATTDGSFSYESSALLPLPTTTSGTLAASTVPYVLTATSSTNTLLTTAVTRTITSSYNPLVTPLTAQVNPTTSVTIGTPAIAPDPTAPVGTIAFTGSPAVPAIGVMGNVVRIPITFNSGFQASAAGITIQYDPGSLSSPVVTITGAAAASGKTISGGIVPITTPLGVAATGYRTLIMNTPNTVGTALPIPDAVVAYLNFTVAYNATAGAVVDLPVNLLEATDLNGNSMAVAPLSLTPGSVNIVSRPGNSFIAPAAPAVIGTDVPVTLARVLSAVYMLLDPVNHPVDGAIDLNADGVVQINEIQRVINAYVGL